MSLKENAENFGPVYGLLVMVSGLASIGAVLTLIPYDGASWPNVLGYKSLCTFTPASTFACALIAAISCTIRVRVVKKSAAPVFIPVVTIVVLLAGLTFSTALWAGEKVKYSDATSAASINQ